MQPMTSPLRFVPRVSGLVPVADGGAGPSLLPHVLQAARALGCDARMEAPDRLCLESGASGRYSPLSFVDGGTIWLATEAGAPVLRYDLSTQGGFLLCAGLSPVAAGLAWFGTGDAGLTAFGLLAPPVWLYGANLLLARMRVPEWLRRCQHPSPRNDTSPWTRLAG